MRLSINLATRPFVELRPLFARLRLVMAGLALLAVALGITLHTISHRAQVAQAQMDALKAQTRALEMERQKNEARMREPQNRAVLERSQFLNTLFASKSFSWTAVMMDLEGVLPAGVQVTTIEPRITPDQDIKIRLLVNGPRDLGVDLVRNLERSQRFLSPHVATESAQQEEQGRMVPVSGMGVPGGVRFDILSGYKPLELALPERYKAASAGAKTGVHKAAAVPGAAVPAKKKTATPGAANKPAAAANKPAAKKAAKTNAPGVVH